MSERESAGRSPDSLQVTIWVTMKVKPFPPLLLQLLISSIFRSTSFDLQSFKVRLSSMFAPGGANCGKGQNPARRGDGTEEA
jgi:hypothetical protein